MRIIKAIFHGLSVAGLTLVATLTILVLTLTLNLTNRDVVKSWPVESGLYGQVPNVALSLIEQENGESFDEAIDKGLLDSTRLKNLLSQVFPAQYWQSKVDGVLDPTYDWLEGKAPALAFKISLADKSDELVEALGDEIRTQLKDAPVCSASQSNKDFDVLTAKCLPRGVSPKSAAASFTDQLTKDGKSPLKEAEFDSDELKLPSGLRERGPEDFARVKALSWILPSLLVLFVLLVGISGKSLLHGFRRAGQTLFSVGIFSWLGFYLAQRFLIPIRIPTEDARQEAVFDQAINPFVNTVVDTISTNGLWVSLTVVIAGILIWLATFIWHKVHHEPEVKHATERSFKEEPTLPKPVEPKTTDKKA